MERRLECEWNDGWSVGSDEDCEQTYDASVSSFSLGSLNLGAKCVPKRFERVKMKLDTGATVITLSLNFAPEGAGDGIHYELRQFEGYDENGLPRSLKGRLTDVHKVLCSAAEIAWRGQQDFGTRNWSGNEGSF